MLNYDCKLCEKFILNSDGTVNKLNGVPTPRPKPPDCSKCDKRNFKNGWEFNNGEVFYLYQLSRAFGRMPENGGLNDQPEELLDAFYTLWSLESASTAARADMMGQLMMAMPRL